MSANSSRSVAKRARIQRALAVCVSACLIGGGSALLAASASRAGADSVGPITFESPTYTTGSVNGQDGWTSTGPFDQGVVNDSGFAGAPPAFGTQSLRISDATTSGTFGDQTFSKPTVNAAGEPGADTGGFPTGTLQTHFNASFDFSSATGGGQAGSVASPMLMSVSPDRGDGARMSYVRMEDDGSRWNLYFSEYKDNAPLGSGGNLNDGCGAEDDFTNTAIGNYSLSAPHNIRFEMKLLPGPHNDVVKVYVDGALVVTGTSWEDYFRYCAESGGGTGGPLADQSRIVRRLIFRVAGDPHPADAGKGILIDNLSEATGSVPGAPRAVSAYPGNGRATVSWKAPLNNGDSPIDGYLVTPVKNGVTQPTQTFNSNATTEVVTGLTNGASYKFRVVARNSFGTSAVATSTGGITVGAPGAPAKPTVTNVGAGSLKVVTKTPATNGSPITKYTATCKSSNGGVTGSNSSSSTTVTVTGLTAGKTYTCRVAATNARGTGPASLPSAQVVA